MTDYFERQDREADELRRERAAEERARFEPLPAEHSSPVKAQAGNATSQGLTAISISERL